MRGFSATSFRDAVGLAIFVLLSVVWGGNAAVCYADGSFDSLDLAFDRAVEAVAGNLSPGSGGGRAAAPGASVTTERWLAPDKLKHAGFSFAGTLAGGAALESLGMAESDSPAWAGASVLCLGLFKEVAMDAGDRRSVASWRDAVANLVGVAAAWLAWEVAKDQ